MQKSYEEVSQVWNKDETNPHYDGSTYNKWSHNCHHFMDDVFTKYKEKGGKFYVKIPTTGEILANALMD